MTTLLQNSKFKIYIKDSVTLTWTELGENGKTILSGNYEKSTLATDDKGMKLNTTVMFTANDDDEFCIVIHEESGGTGPAAPSDNDDAKHGILELIPSNAATNNSVNAVANFKLKHFQSDKIILASNWTLKQLNTTGGTAAGNTPLAGENVTTMTTDSPHGGGMLVSNTYELQILVGKTNIGWNIAILDKVFGMADNPTGDGQGNVFFANVDPSQEGIVEDQASWTTLSDNGGSSSRRKVGDLEHSQPVNLKKGTKSGFTMVGWYKSWMKALPKLVDVFNIVDKVYYYDGATNTYVEIPKNSGSPGDWDGPSTLSGNGKNAQVWNISTNGLTTGIWVKVSKTIEDFDPTSLGVELGGRETNSSDPKAPFVFLTYKQ